MNVTRFGATKQESYVSLLLASALLASGVIAVLEKAPSAADIEVFARKNKPALWGADAANTTL